MYFQNIEHSKLVYLPFSPCTDSHEQQHICTVLLPMADKMFRQNLAELLLFVATDDMPKATKPGSQYVGSLLPLELLPLCDQNFHDSRRRILKYLLKFHLRSFSPKSAKPIAVCRHVRTKNMNASFESTYLPYMGRFDNTIIVMQIMSLSQCQHYIN